MIISDVPALANFSELIEDACSGGTYLLEVKQELMDIKERGLLSSREYRNIVK